MKFSAKETAGLPGAGVMVFMPKFGYLGVTVTEPAIWCMCAVFLGIFYGHQKQESTEACGS